MKTYLNDEKIQNAMVLMICQWMKANGKEPNRLATNKEERDLAIALGNLRAIKKKQS